MDGHAYLQPFVSGFRPFSKRSVERLLMCHLAAICAAGKADIQRFGSSTISGLLTFCNKQHDFGVSVVSGGADALVFC
jgi:hypothetical protein